MITQHKQSFTHALAQNDTIYLRKISLEDAQFIRNLTNEPAWLTNIGDKKIYSLAKAKDFIKTGPMQTYKRYGFGLYLVVMKDQHKPLGVCGLLKRSYLNAPDLGYAISQDFYRRGFAQMSCELVLNMANKLTKSSYIYASTKDINQASQNLLVKLGFTKEGGLVSADEEDNLLLFRKIIKRQ